MANGHLGKSSLDIRCAYQLDKPRLWSSCLHLLLFDHVDNSNGREHDTWGKLQGKHQNVSGIEEGRAGDRGHR
jgi:hypothetical protein